MIKNILIIVKQRSSCDSLLLACASYHQATKSEFPSVAFSFPSRKATRESLSPLDLCRRARGITSPPSAAPAAGGRGGFLVLQLRLVDS